MKEKNLPLLLQRFLDGEQIVIVDRSREKDTINVALTDTKDFNTYNVEFPIELYLNVASFVNGYEVESDFIYVNHGHPVYDNEGQYEDSVTLYTVDEFFEDYTMFEDETTKLSVRLYLEEKASLNNWFEPRRIKPELLQAVPKTDNKAA